MANEVSELLGSNSNAALRMLIQSLTYRFMNESCLNAITALGSIALWNNAYRRIDNPYLLQNQEFSHKNNNKNNDKNKGKKLCRSHVLQIRDFYLCHLNS